MSHKTASRLSRIFAVIALIAALIAVAPPAHAHSTSNWTCLAHYESTHRWQYNGTYDGGLQFSVSTWREYTGSSAPAYAWQATPRFQIEVARRVVYKGFYRHEPQGWTAWRKNWWKCN